MKKRGSALLIAVFLMTAISGVSFSIARLYFVDVKIAATYENSAVAYYAAESGVEEGFLRYRYNKNVEMPTSSDTINRYSLTEGTFLGNSIPEGEPVDLESEGDVVFDFSSRYLVPFYGSDTNNSKTFSGAEDLISPVAQNDYLEYKIDRDEAVKIDVTDIANGSMTDGNLYVYFESYNNNLNDKGNLIEAKVTGKIANGNLVEQKVALLPTGSEGNYDPESMVIMNPVVSGGDTYYQITNFLNTIKEKTSLFSMPSSGFFNEGSGVTFSIKPIGCAIRIAIVPNNGTPMAGPYTKILSRGNYSGVTRTLEANIDRQAGTLYDLFDFVIYKKS